METLIVIGIVLALVTTMLAIVERMAEVRGRDRRAWTIAALVGICVFLVGWLVVVAALIVVGPTRERQAAVHPGTAASHKPSHP